MKIINPITVAIMNETRNGDSIREVSRKTGFAYSAVYRWVMALVDYGVLSLENHGNRKEIFVNKIPLYLKFTELSHYVHVLEGDKTFWRLMKKTRLGVRFVMDTAAVVWSQGGYVTGDFYDKIYHVEVLERDLTAFEQMLKKRNIEFGKEVRGANRPFVCIKTRKKIRIEKKNGLPVMPLKELVTWCMKLDLEPVLEQLDTMYNLGLKIKYSEVLTNV